MNQEERLDSILQDYINDRRMRRGGCPNGETLVAFQEGTLAAEATDKIQAHVEACGFCQRKLRLLHKFDECEQAEFHEPPDWPEIERRTRDRFYAFLASQAKKKRVHEAGKGFWVKVKAVCAHPALAYLLVLALLYPAYRGLFRKPEVVREPVRVREVVQVEKPAFDIATLRAFELKSPERTATGGRAVVRLSPDEAHFVLSFFVPISERPEFVYDVEIRDRQGQLVAAEKAARAQDELGNFLLVCRRELFSPGEYELQVKEVNKMTQAVRREFSFSFTVESAPPRHGGRRD